MNKEEISNMINKIKTNMGIEKVRKEIEKEIVLISSVANLENLQELLNEFIKYPEGVRAISNNWRQIYNNATNCLSLIDIFSRIDTVRMEMLNNLPFLINYGKVYDTAQLAKKLSVIDGGDEAIANNFEIMFENIISNPEYFAISLTKTELGRKKLIENIDSIKKMFLDKLKSKNSNVSGFFNFIKLLKDIPELESEYETYSYWIELYDQIQVPSYKQSTVEELISMLLDKKIEGKNFLFASHEAGAIKDSVFANIVLSPDKEEKQIILQEVSKGNKYKFVANGTSSLVIQADEKIVKIGRLRRNYEIPYHPRIMMPYFRKKYSDGSCLEVFNYGITNSQDITDEKLLEIFKELEEAGIFWGDARKENLLVLTKDNELPDFIASKEFNVMGFLEDDRFPTNNHIVLKKGDIVICDLDMLYAKNDPNRDIGIMDPIIEKYLDSKEREKYHEERQ